MGIVFFIYLFICLFIHLFIYLNFQNLFNSVNISNIFWKILRQKEVLNNKMDTFHVFATSLQRKVFSFEFVV